MGCDIHTLIEISHRRAPDVGGQDAADNWLLFAQPWLGRSYACFAALAGVRATSEGEAPLYPLRGLPLSLDETSEDRYGSLRGPGLHPHGFLSPSEVDCALRHAAIDPQSLLTEWQAVLGAMRILEQEFEVRLVFCFDN